MSVVFISCKNQNESSENKQIIPETQEQIIGLHEVIDFNEEHFNLANRDSVEAQDSLDVFNVSKNMFLKSLRALKDENDLEKSKNLFEKFLKLPNVNDQKEIKLFYDFLVCDWYIINERRDETKELVNKIKKGARSIDNVTLKYFAIYIEGKALCNEYQYDEGIEKLLEVYTAIEKDSTIQINKYLILNNLAVNFYEINKYDKAMEYLKIAHKELYNTNKLSALYITYANMGNVLNYQGKNQASVDTLLKAIEINKKLNKTNANIISYYNIGNSLIEVKKYEIAKSYFEQGLALVKENKFEVGYAYHYYGLGSCFYRTKKYDVAIQYYKKSIAYARQFDNKPILFNSLNDLIDIYKTNKNSTELLALFDEYNQLKEEYNRYILNEKVEEMILKMDVEKINAQNKLLSQKVEFEGKINRNKTLLIYAESLVVIMVLIFVILLSKTIRKKQKINQALEEQKKETETLNKNLIRLIADRDNLVKTIIHDLRNPLSAIKGCSALISQEVDEREKEILLNMMNSSSNRLDILISSLLNSYTADDEQLDENQLVLTKVDEFIKNIVENFEFEAKLKNIEINAFLEPLKLKVNQNGLFSIVGNLLSNSIKYSPKNTVIKLSLLNEKEAWKIIVSDQGPGFTAADYEKMFQLQTTLSSSPTGNEISTGIGLYSIKKTVERYKGSIALNKNYKVGAEFVIAFPKKSKK